METRFSEPIDWKAVAAAFAIWAAHFSLLWAGSSVFPADQAARWIALAGTIAALGALAVLMVRCARTSSAAVPLLACGLSATAVLFGALPALIG